jgi:hypothetical protein
MEVLYVLGGYCGVFAPVILLLLQMDKQGPIRTEGTNSSTILSTEKSNIEIKYLPSENEEMVA